jgi:hypothetical protein
MTRQTKILFSMASLLCLVIGLGTIFIICQKIFSMPFRATNDVLHKQEAPITLDFLIPGGTHIDDKMTIGQVIRIRFEKPEGRMNNLVYFFMPDLVLGRIDDVVFLGWALAFAGAGWWYAKRKRLQYY